MAAGLCLLLGVSASAGMAQAPASTMAPSFDAAESAFGREAMPYADFIAKAMWRPVNDDDPKGRHGLAETEQRFNGVRWYWTDDDAKAVEVFSAPVVYNAYPEIAEGMLDFLLDMTSGPFIIRRRSENQISFISEDLSKFQVQTGLMNVHGNLRAGQLALSYRFNDGRTVDAVLLSGNGVRFVYEGAEYYLDAEDNIADVRVEKADTYADIIIVSDFRIKGSASPVARATYVYRVDSKRTVIDVTATVEALGDAALSNVRLTTSVDQLDNLDGSIRYDRFCHEAAEKVSCAGADGGERKVLISGPVNWHSVVQMGSLGFSYGMHVLAQNGDKHIQTVAEGQKNGKFHWIYSTYGADAVTKATPFTIKESRLLTAGGLYRSIENYGALLRQALEQQSTDFSISYDYGAELNALAAYYMFAGTGKYAAMPSKERLAQVKDTFDRHLKLYTENFLFHRMEGDRKVYPYIFGRGIAFVALGADSMYRATGDRQYLDAMRRMVDVMLDMQVSHQSALFDGAFRCSAVDVYLDCHAAMLLAIARATAWLEDERYKSSVIRGLHAIRSAVWEFRSESTVVESRGDAAFVFINPGQRNDSLDGALWGFKGGLILRAVHAIEYAGKTGRLQLNSYDRRHLAQLDRFTTMYLDASTMPRPGLGLEVKTSFRSGETNSETQPWTLLGLAPLDPVIEAVLPVNPGRN